MRPNLLEWQWSLYQDNHVDRRNLVVHILTVPMFMTGTLMLVCSPVTGIYGAIVGLISMVIAVAAQGRTHKLETKPPVPFEGPADVISRIFVEQWITFPRFVLSGGFAKAWAATSAPR